jgi:hypothetical protein
MRTSPIPLAVSGLLGALLGFSAAALWLGGQPPPVPLVAPMALRPSLEGDAGQPPALKEAGSGRKTHASRGGAGGDGSMEEGNAGAAELKELRDRARAAEERLSMQRKRIAQLEAELPESPPPRPERTRHEFDLDGDDWRKMAADGVMKYRLPCDLPDDKAFDELALAPDDRDVVRHAFANSADRLRSTILPLCAAALGDRTDVAQNLTTDACRQMLLSTASDRSESNLLSAHNVAAFMAGDAPRPGHDSPLTERMFLALAEESKRFEDELAEAFGPEEAHRLAFSENLCFRTSTHNYVSRPNAPTRPSTPGPSGETRP